MTAGPAAAREVTRILVLDDVAENLRLMGELLAASPVEVSLAKSGQQALRLAARVPFQLAILDLNLPDIDGFEVARQMRALQPDCGFIYCSAYNDRTRRDRAFAEGALDFIEKPLEIGSARQRLATHLERLALREGLKTEKERLAKVVASIPDAVVSLDREQRVVTWNPAAERVFGVPAADALGSRFDRFVPQAAAAAAPGTVQETMGRRGDGTPIHLELGASPWVQGEAPSSR